MLLKVCESVQIQISEEIALVVEKETRSQSESKVWFKFSATWLCNCITNESCLSYRSIKPLPKPSESYMQSRIIQLHKQGNSQGCRHEKTARNSCMKEIRRAHINLTVNDCGLLVTPKWPLSEASHDGLLSCECCGKGKLETKSPYSHRSNSYLLLLSVTKHFAFTLHQIDFFILITVMHIITKHKHNCSSVISITVIFCLHIC